MLGNGFAVSSELVIFCFQLSSLSLYCVGELLHFILEVLKQTKGTTKHIEGKDGLLGSKVKESKVYFNIRLTFSVLTNL